MALVDPYSACPCGSGQKYKWCCHKAETAAIRVERLIVNEQFDQAMRAVDDALTKDPNALWLLSQKEYLHDRKGEWAEARKPAERMTAIRPDHETAWLARVRLAILTEGARAGIDELQRGLAACEGAAATGPKLRKATALVGTVLHEKGDYVPAMAHLVLAAADDASDDEEDGGLPADQALQQLLADPGVSLWAKAAHELLPCPDSLTGEARERFEAAMADGDRGLWSRASARFETLAADGVAEAEHNLGLCRLWLGDSFRGAEALRRYIAGLGATTEAVDLEALVQLDEPVGTNDLEERVRLSWTLKNRAGLIEALTREVEARTALNQGEDVLSPDDPKSPKVLLFTLLDGRVPEYRPGLAVSDLPRIESNVLVAADAVYLDSFDDAGLNARRDRFIDLAGSCIPPAHPRLKVIGRVPRHVRAMQANIVMPGDLPPLEYRRLIDERARKMLREVWLVTPMPFLRGRSPKQAAAAGDAEVPLRAALCVYDGSRAGADGPSAEIRAELGLPAEPVVEPNIEGLLRLNPGRLGLVRVEGLDDLQLDLLRARGMTTGLRPVLESACRAWLARPEALNARPAAERYAVFADLVRCLLAQVQNDEALETLELGRRDEPAEHRAENAVHWDLLEVRVRARFEEPELWVTRLAATMERYRNAPEDSSAVLLSMIELGLVRPVANPDKPEEILLDSRPLTMLLERYGPRVVTPDGALGVSAGKSEIWTPEKAAGGGQGGIWTPGSSAAPDAPAGASKLIIPGR